jgi:DNA polymerase-1
VAITLRQAKQFIKRYFDGYPRIRSWQDRALRDGERTATARTLWGRRRFLDPKKARNEFLNTPIQGTGADGLKRALRNVYFGLKQFEGRAKMIHMVHDEIVVECDDDPELVPQVKKTIEQCMMDGIQPMLPDVPVVAEADVGASWAAH